MASLIQDLQELLKVERGMVEAVRLFEDDIEDVDPDIADGLNDIEQSSTWACQGLHHRITQLGGTPSLLTSDLQARVLESPELQDRLKVLCGEQRALKRQAADIMKRDDLDGPTREFLDEAKRLHQQATVWCENILLQWKPEAYLQP